MRLIDADALKYTLQTYFSLEDGGTAMQIAAIRAIDSAPTIQPEKPKRESRAMLPCKCGCKRREHWYGGGHGGSLIGHTESLVCCKCGFKVDGKNATDVIRRWNKAVSESAVD